MNIELLNQLIKDYPTTQQVIFAPIYHSEYFIEFYKVNNEWEYDGNKLIYHDAEYCGEDWNSHNCNAYSTGSSRDKADFRINICSYLRDDNVLVIVS